MKKLMIIATMMTLVGSMAFSKEVYRRDYHHNREYCNGDYCRTYNNHRNYNNNNRGYVKDSESRILLDEKKIEIRKELLKDNPDWAKIERLKVEMATDSAKESARQMKERHELRRQRALQKVATPENN